ncbi:MAG TPA: fumarylacetoacetate hydrolase family protein [Vicinamibacterales bacterium]|nr:fumarylacetoacetate hydrolase family protein [Vicinamibacterales bacterium]
MTRLYSAFVAAAGLAAALMMATPAAQTAAPYKLGMFQQGNRVFAGLVVQNDALVIDLSTANAGAPATVKQIIAAWDTKLGAQFAALASKPPASALKVAELKVLPPITDPRVLLSTAVNYTEHALEMTGKANTAASAAAVDPKVAQGIPGYWARRPGDPRHNPYFFVKANSAITGNLDPIVLPRGRDRIDWECEMNIVIGRTAKYVSRDNAADYIFGYTLMNDVSDRGGRPDGRHGSDWQLGKSHDTFAPLGPYVVPRQFVPNPQKLAVKFTLSSKVMQDSNTDRMTHNVFELVEYASHMMTLHPGDLISTGSPAGVGTARATPIYFKDGDTSVCTIESIGTLQNPVRAEK